MIGRFGHISRVLSALLLLALPAAATTRLDETFDETYPFEPGARLELSNVNGELEILTWDRHEARVEAQKKVRARSESRAKEALAALQIEVTQDSGGLSVETRRPKKVSWWSNGEASVSVSYRVTLPRRADLDVRTVNGKVIVTGVTGDLRLRTTNGKVAVDDCGGRVDASTTNGGIEVELDTVDPGADLSLSSTNGSIRLHLPGDARADLHARTTNGSIETDFPVEVHGRVSRKSLEGTINGGGGKIELRTTNGSISIHEN